MYNSSFVFKGFFSIKRHRKDVSDFIGSTYGIQEGGWVISSIMGRVLPREFNTSLHNGLSMDAGVAILSLIRCLCLNGVWRQSVGVGSWLV